MTDTQRPWDRLTPDSDPAYEAFAAYLDTGSLRDAYRQRSAPRFRGSPAESPRRPRRPSPSNRLESPVASSPRARGRRAVEKEP